MTPVDEETLKLAIQLAAPAVQDLLTSSKMKSVVTIRIVNAYHAVVAAREEISKGSTPV